MKKTFLAILAVGLILGSSSSLNFASAKEIKPASSISNSLNTAKGWQIYENHAAGFSLKIPDNVKLLGAEEINADSPLTVTIETEKIELIDDTPLNDEIKAKKDEQELVNGNYGEEIDFALEASKQVKNLGKVNGKEFMTLARLEVCDVTFERKLVFYTNGYRTIVSLHGPINNIRSNNSGYFKVDDNECGNELIWNYGSENVQDQFYQDLKNHKLSEEADNWFNSFDQMVDTITIK